MVNDGLPYIRISFTLSNERLVDVDCRRTNIEEDAARPGADENRSEGTLGLIRISKHELLTEPQNFEYGMSNFEGILEIRSAFDIPCSSFAVSKSY